MNHVIQIIRGFFAKGFNNGFMDIVFVPEYFIRYGIETG
jgi:hypothetical protein